MKTRLLIFLVLFLKIHCLSSQDFAPIGAKWYFPETYAFSNKIGVITWESIGDTIIANKICRILYKDRKTCYIGPKGNHYFHQRADTLFHFDHENETFDMIIDFSAQKGESWIIEENSGLLSDTIFCTVDSISYRTISNLDSLKVQHVNMKTTDFYMSGEDTIYLEWDTEIIEKIGFVWALLPTKPFTICDGNYEGNIRCYEDNELGLIQWSVEACNFTPVKDLTKLKNINVYPNPSKNRLHIDSDDVEIIKYEIIDIQGQQIKKILHAKEIEIINVSSGIYILRIFTKHGILTKKFVIEN